MGENERQQPAGIILNRVMADHWEIMDIYKALMAVGAGFILGLERELKDKVAGLKTITIICLGAALFSILSYKVNPGNPTLIASYVVSGVGFLGAGAIFKDGFSVSGLTTAGIIWLAAAVGLSIGFGEFYLAATFMVASMFIIFSTPFINRIFRHKKLTRQLTIVFSKEDREMHEEIMSKLNGKGIQAEIKKITMKADETEIVAEIVLVQEKLSGLQDYLASNKRIRSFSL